MSLLIENAKIITVNALSEVIDKGFVLISDGKIEQVGSGVFEGEVLQRVDAKGCALLPGWVNTHTHSAMSIYRGLADDIALKDWLEKHIWPAEAAFGNASNVRVGGRLAMMEMIASGTTTFNDMYFFQTAMAEEVDSFGMRAVLGEGILDFPTPFIKNPNQALEIIESEVRNWSGSDLIGFAITPHAPYTVSKERIIGAKKLSEKLGIGLHTHLSETAFEVAQCQELHGVSPVKYLDDLGVLDSSVVAAHCVHVSEQDMEIIAKKGMSVAHNPHSNMKLGSGIAPISGMLSKDITVGVGTDGAASNNNLNMYLELSSASKMAKAFHQDPTVLPALKMLEMGTIDGARMLGLEDKIGSIEVGKRADIQIVELDRQEVLPIYDIISHLIFAMNGSQVRDVMVDGKFIYRNRVFKTINKEKVFEEVRALAAQIR